jgi:hypothetical protein
MADIKTLAKRPAESLDNLGDQLQFYVRALVWAPRTVRRYKKETGRLLGEVTLVPVKKVSMVMTPTVPPIVARAPDPSVTSPRSRPVSFL